MEIRNRCRWVNMKNPAYIKYHDTEWGVPCHDDQKLYEFLILECFQAGLSWECILNKRQGFNAAFDNFDINKVILYNAEKQKELLADASIIRNRLKIKAAVTNSAVFKKIQQESGSFDSYLWHFSNGQVVQEEYTIRTTSPLSDTISKDLKKRGMKFVGSTIIYAYLQAVGIINGHEKGCDCCIIRR